MNEQVRRNAFVEDNQSLRGFLRMVDAEYPDEILRIREPVDLRFETTSIIFELDRAGRSPVVVFENVGGRSMPVVTNVAGNRKLLAACLGVRVEDLPGAFRQRCQTYLPCETVERAEWDEIVIEGDELDLADPSPCNSPLMAHPISPPARSARAILSPASMPTGFIV